ncbi:DUF6259 domain-containing protein [Pedobacter nyackensis]|uniref:DUF6259 domain-containing protein n=1 Tax=Pedobacter nyackensis TaxID=475255 RepID=A0A1W2EP67_9SPHI|nr:DUF6259 domain-containing protein [Pedobacter nyackensis]SMD11507.1 hypothetical protein SAMN04488101_11443 [Pedobacter nyackensis]
MRKVHLMLLLAMLCLFPGIIYAQANQSASISNQWIEVVFNKTTGELQRLINKKTGENVLKNWSAKKSMPFGLLVRKGNEKAQLVTAPGTENVKDNKQLAVGVKLDTEVDGTSVIQIRYPQLFTEKGILNILAEVTVRIPKNSKESFWSMSLSNQEDNCTIDDVRFPCFFGVYLGDTWKDDELVYPYHSGEKILNPVESYEKGSASIGWRWQDYKYTYKAGASTAIKDKDDLYFREFKYSPRLSMMWLDYYDQNGGLYMASYEDKPGMAAIRAETPGKDMPGMGFYMIKNPDLKKGQSWQSHNYSVALHPGDWHWAADQYRNWKHQSLQKYLKPYLTPDWFSKSPGLVAHYDFKYQNGSVVHRFKDLPRLLKEAKEMGLNHLLLSGWHVDGFDNGFPMYTPDPELGTEAEFIKYIKEVNDAGGHVMFYLNSRLFNMKYTDLKDKIDLWAVKNEKGENRVEKYGNGNISFAVMCPNYSGWQNQMFNTIQYLVKKAGAHGIYLDQLGMGTPELCFNKAHHHEHDRWIDGQMQLLERVHQDITVPEASEKDKQVAIIFEGASDNYGNYASGQLISTFSHYFTGAFPELYRYTFPGQTLVDMVYPSKNQVMRPVHISRVSKEMIDHSFLLGNYLWAYDLEEDNSFRNDPEMMAYLKQVISLRKAWLSKFANALFRDDLGLETGKSAIVAKHFDLQKGKLITVKNVSGKKWELMVDTYGKKVTRVMLYNMSGGEVSIPFKQVSYKNKPYLRIESKSERLAFLHFSY